MWIVTTYLAISIASLINEFFLCQIFFSVTFLLK